LLGIQAVTSTGRQKGMSNGEIMWNKKNRRADRPSGDNLDSTSDSVYSGLEMKPKREGEVKDISLVTLTKESEDAMTSRVLRKALVDTDLENVNVHGATLSLYRRPNIH
jgi:hypothetical protein